MPVASGSSVPACPAFWALNRRRTRLTACVDVISYGLSRQTQPETASPFLRRPISIRVRRVEVSAHARIVEQPAHPRGLVEALVMQELQVGGELHLDVASEPAAQELGVPVEGRDHLRRMLAAQ